MIILVFFTFTRISFDIFDSSYNGLYFSESPQNEIHKLNFKEIFKVYII